MTMSNFMILLRFQIQAPTQEDIAGCNKIQ